MDHLWSPWRYRYVSTAGPTEECIFCSMAASDRDSDHYVVYRAAFNFVVLNLYPYTTGHLMVVPYQHAGALEELPDETLTELMLLARDAGKHLREEYHPEGMNLGLNLGRCAGAGIAGHLHMHVVPRWTGDANFMSTVGETRVMSEDLPVTYERLTRAFRKSSGAPM